MKVLNFLLIGCESPCIMDCIWWHTYDLFLIYAGLRSLSRCSKLSILKLGICLNLNDEGLGHIGMCCSKLLELDLYRFMTSHDFFSLFLRDLDLE